MDLHSAFLLSTNASNHYCPTIVISKENYANWQLEQVALLSKAQLALIQEIEINDVSDVNAVHIDVLKEQLNYTIQLFGPTVNTGAAATRAKAKARVPGVLFTNAPGIPQQTPQSSVSQPGPALLVPAPPTPQPSPAKKNKKGKTYLCEQCSKSFYKKTDFDDHMSREHNVGKDLKCTHCDKVLSTQRSKKQHIRAQHLKIFKYPCPVLNCDWKSDAKGLLTTHMVSKYGEEQEEEYRCHLCHKLFQGDNLLKRHLRAAMCQVVKNFDCQQCKPLKWFKVRNNLVHVKKYHTQELPMLTCNECKKVFGTKGALSNYKVLHRGAAVLTRAKNNQEGKGCKNCTRQSSSQKEKRQAQQISSSQDDTIC